MMPSVARPIAVAIACAALAGLGPSGLGAVRAVAEAPADGFLPLAQWEARVDRVENPRQDKLTHVYVTLRNATHGQLVQTQGVTLFLALSNGVELTSGQSLRARPGPPELFGSPPPVTEPGGTIAAKFVFDRHQGAAPTRVTVEEAGKEADFAF